MFGRLGERRVIPGELAARLAAASGLGNLIAHRYGALDSARVHDLAQRGLGDLLDFCCGRS